MTENKLKFSGPAAGALRDLLAGEARERLETLLAGHAGSWPGSAQDMPNAQATPAEFPSGFVTGGRAGPRGAPQFELRAGPDDEGTATGRLVLDLAACLPGADLPVRAARRLGQAALGELPAFEVGLRPIGDTAAGLSWLDGPVPAALVDLVLAGRAPEPWSPGLRLTGLGCIAEVEWWAGVLADDAAGAPAAVTLGIDTVAAVIEAETWLDRLGTRVTALCWDRWASLRSILQRFRGDPLRLLPDLAELDGAARCQRAWGLRVIGVAAERGLAAIAPVLSARHDGADRGLRAGLERLLRDGYDVLAAADPAGLEQAREVVAGLAGATGEACDRGERPRLTGADLLHVPTGKITEAGLRASLRTALAGWQAWRAGRAFAEVDGQRVGRSRVALAADQLWQARRHETGVLDDGRIVDRALFERLLDEEQAATGRVEAAEALSRHVLADELSGEFPLAAG